MRAILTAAGMAATILVVSHGPAASQDAETEKLVRPVKMIEIAERATLLRFTQPTVIEPDVSADLTIQVGGVLEELPVREGMSVKQGDLIAQVDPLILENDVNQAAAQLEQAEIEFRRAQTLLQQGNISESAFDQRKTQRDIALLSLEAARKRLEDATLLAPFDGVVAVVHVERYQTVSPQTQVITLQSQDEFVAVVQVPARTIAEAGNADVVRSVVQLDVAPLREIPATFRSLATQADPATQTYEGRALFSRPDDLNVLSGMTGQVVFDVVQNLPEGSDPGVEVPVAAVQYDGTRTFVWVVDETSMTVSRRDITIGTGIGVSVRVSEGLAAGDVIVGAGASYMHEGLQVSRFED